MPSSAVARMHINSCDKQGCFVYNTAHWMQYWHNSKTAIWG